MAVWKVTPYYRLREPTLVLINCFAFYASPLIIPLKNVRHYFTESNATCGKLKEMCHVCISACEKYKSAYVYETGGHLYDRIN